MSIEVWRCVEVCVEVRQKTDIHPINLCVEMRGSGEEGLSGSWVC